MTQLGTGLDSARAKAQAHREFEAWAATYDQSLLHHFLFTPSYMMLMEEIGDWYRLRRPASFSVLDIGCGTGTVAGLLASSSWPVKATGLDFAPAMCAEARQKAEKAGLLDRASFLAGDSEHLPIADASFDVVTCSNSFHHYPNQQEVVLEMRRILKPGGRLILIDGFRDNVIGWFVFDVVITAIEKDVHHAPWPRIHDYFSKANLTNIHRKKTSLWFPLLATIGDVA